MESEGLKQFLNSIGDAVYSLNTVCVGLEGVASGKVTKPKGLTITWRTNDPVRTAMSARGFAIRSSLVMSEAALDNYINFLSTCENQTSKVVAACKEDGTANRIAMLSKQVSDLENYWLPFVTLMVRWRNKIIHNSASRFSPLHRKIIQENSSLIKSRHAGILVDETIDNYDIDKITLKDFSTFIAITIKFVRHIDKYLEPTVANIETFEKQLKERNLESIFKRVIGVNGKDKQKTKFKSFINSNFTSISDGEFDELFNSRFVILKKSNN